MPINVREALTIAPPANPSCIGAVTRKTREISRRRPVRSGPPTIATMPTLAVTALLHDLAIAVITSPGRGSPSAVASGGRLWGVLVRITAIPVAGSHPASSASNPSSS